MQQYPQLRSDQFAVVRADAMTGHVLDESCELFVHNPQQNVYTIFDTFDDAVKYIEGAKSESHKIDYAIYDSNNTVVKYFPYFS